MESRFLRAFKGVERDKKDADMLPVVFKNGIAVKMPLELVLMRAGFSKRELEIITAVMKKIGEKVYDKLMKGELSNLFSDEEFGEDPSELRFVIHRKDFGHLAKYVDELEESMKLMRMIPIDLPVVGKSGTEYVKYTNFCSIHVPTDIKENEDVYYIVTMSKDVAEHILHPDFQYASILEAANKKLRSKFTLQIYWIIQLFAWKGSHVFDLKELREKLCHDDAPIYEKYSVFLSRILEQAKKDIDKLFNEGLCEYRFEFHPNRQEYESANPRKTPKTVEFVITQTNLAGTNPQKKISKVIAEDVASKLVEEFGINQKNAKEFALKINNGNTEAFDKKIEDIRKRIKAGEVEKVEPFVYTSLKRFFDDLEKEEKKEYADYEEITDETPQEPQAKPEEPVKVSRDQNYWASQWHKCQMAGSSTIVEGIAEGFSLMFFVSYEEKEHLLKLSVPSHIVRDFFVNSFRHHFTMVLQTYFGKDVKYEFIVKYDAGTKAALKEFEEIYAVRKKIDNDPEIKWTSCHNEMSAHDNIFHTNVALDFIDASKSHIQLLVKGHEAYEYIERTQVGFLTELLRRYFGPYIKLTYKIVDHFDPDQEPIRR